MDYLERLEKENLIYGEYPGKKIENCVENFEEEN